MKKDCNVVYLTDENYVMPTAVSVVSLLNNCASAVRYHVYILMHKISEESRKLLLKLKSPNASFHFIELAAGKYEELEQTCLSKGIHVSETSMYKFDIADLLSHIDKVLYLDSDILVNQDIAEMFDYDISEYYLAAVDDMGDQYDQNGSFLAGRIGIKNQRYFNSGVMMLNLKKLREKAAGKRLFEYRSAGENYFMDQDAFNAVLGEKRLALPYQYNFRSVLLDEMESGEIGARFYHKNFDSYDDCIKEQKIIHVTGGLKPWNYYIYYFTDLFIGYYEKTPYQDQKLHMKSLAAYISELSKGFESAVNKLNFMKMECGRKVWGIPFDKVKKGSRVILYGAGSAGTDLKVQIDKTGYCEVVLWVDADYAGKSADISSPGCIRDVEYDKIIVAVVKEDTVRRIIEELTSKYRIPDNIIVTLY